VPAQPSVGEENNILAILVLCVVWVAVSAAILAAGRLYRTMTARSLAVFAVCGFGMALNILSMAPGDADSRASGFLLSLLLWTMLGLMLSVGGAITSTAALHVLGRRSPGLTSSTAALLTWKPARRATAMALVRGAAWGLLALGLREALAVVIMPLGLEWAEAPEASVVFSPVAGLVTLSRALFSAFVTVALMALVLGFIRRRTESWPWCGVAGAVVAAVMHFGRWDSATVALVAVGAILAAAIVWHDLLTGLVAALTFWIWSDAYPVLRILERVGNGGVMALFVLWAIAIAWAAAVGLPDLWAAARRQVSDLA